jgi:hypothetical protein
MQVSQSSTQQPPPDSLTMDTRTRLDGEQSAGDGASPGRDTAQSDGSGRAAHRRPSCRADAAKGKTGCCTRIHKGKISCVHGARHQGVALMIADVTQARLVLYESFRQSRPGSAPSRHAGVDEREHQGQRHDQGFDDACICVCIYAARGQGWASLEGLISGVDGEYRREERETEVESEMEREGAWIGMRRCGLGSGSGSGPARHLTPSIPCGPTWADWHLPKVHASTAVHGAFPSPCVCNQC